MVKPELQAILKLRVPVIVRLAGRRMLLRDVLDLGPGAIIELPKSADEPLDLMVNNKLVGRGRAVKVGENFGLRVDEIDGPRDRLKAVQQATADQDATDAGSPTASDKPPNPSPPADGA